MVTKCYWKYVVHVDKNHFPSLYGIALEQNINKHEIISLDLVGLLDWNEALPSF